MSRPLSFSPSGPVEVVDGIRIGITKAVDLPWRYRLKNLRFLSKPFPPTGGRAAGR